MRRSWFLLLVLAGFATIVFFGISHPALRRTRHLERHDVQAPAAGTAGVSIAAAQPAAPERSVLEIIHPANAAALTAALPAPTRQIEYVHVDRARIEGKASPFWPARGEGHLTLPLPGGGAVAVVIDSSEMLGASRFTSTGHVAGVPQSRAVFAYNEGFLTASIETPEHAYALRPATLDAAQLYEIQPDLVPACGGVRHPEIDPTILAAAAARKAAQARTVAGSGTAPAVVAAAEAPQHAEIHLMMLYTQAVKPTLTGAARVAALQSEFDAAVAKVNNELAASLVTARVKLVKIAETQYAETTSASDQVQDDALTALYKLSDGKMDEIHALRDEVGADVVCLVLNRSDSASIGLSFVLDSPSAQDPSAAATNPFYAFAVVQYATIAGTDVLPHELGHVFGCAHARGDPGTTGTNDGAYSYSYGYRFFGRDGRQYHDIMAYSPGTPLGYYSNPNVTVPSPVSTAIGVVSGQSGEADCARTIEKDAFEVSTYRLQTQAAPAGTLVNVSTRSYVGTGDQVLIGGFTIDGAQAKRVLVRAAGPALAAYGVTDAVPNPRIRVYGNGSVIAENDDWSNQPAAADVAAAGSQVSAFPFTAGSPDAAVLLTLQPGAYSAVIDGVGGAAGSGLVEVYDVDRTGNRIINLSTRGYSDKGREMFGGFVVQGAAGTTKRILVRVLGPTLGKTFGVTGAMDDPMLELHNESGDLLLKNDDWSSTTTAGTPGPTNDFSPAVKSYSEQQIFATGFAPSNRREPCVMLDLAPGSYSVIAQPFEDLNASPPQVAAGGVVIIEVYEIAK